MPKKPRPNALPMLPGFGDYNSKSRSYSVPEGFVPPPGVSLSHGDTRISRRQYRKLIGRPLSNGNGGGKTNDYYNSVLNSYIFSEYATDQALPLTKKGKPSRKAVRESAEFKALYKALKDPKLKNVKDYAKFLGDPVLRADTSSDGIIADILRKIGRKKDTSYPVGETPK